MNDTFTIQTNRHPREVIDAWALDPSERDEFDYLDWPAIERGEDSRSFVRYRGRLYDLGDVMAIHGDMMTPQMSAAGFGQWDGYVSDSYFSGVLFRFAGFDGEHVVCATYYS